MRKIIFAVITVIALAFGAITLEACGNTEKYDIVCTIFPQYDFVKEIVGDECKVKMLLPYGTDAHNYELKLGDKKAIADSKLFICIGGESEKWVGGVQKSTDLSNVSVITWMEHADLIAIKEEKTHKHESEEGKFDDYDEHVYLSIKNCKNFVTVISEELCWLYPEKSDVFKKNAAKLTGELTALDGDYEQLAAATTNGTIYFADRFPFAYLVRDYGWKCVTPYKGCSADLEISISDKVEFTDAYENSQAKGVCIIENGNKELANSVLREKSGEIFELHSCQAVSKKEMESNTHYVDLMRKNLGIFREALL